MRKTTRFSAPIGNKELSLELDEQRGQLVFELSDTFRVVLHKMVLSKPEEIREITGKWWDHFQFNIVLVYDLIDVWVLF